ncbi:MAG: prepilin-type N-terminal cleavage/methylation domain-containing protein [Nitrospirae bacterium]|nr:prepilin-type N-terminal cleavage/methylation domain-containing protein [Nitrospirota bacterium]
MNNKKGFTLVELIIVITIIGILAMLAVPAYIGQQRNAARSEAFANLQALRLLEEQFFAESGAYTASAANVAAIQAAGVLPRFQPGPVGGLNYSYQIVSGQQITATNPLAFGAGANCFYARATGNAGTRVAGDDFAIDCNNNRNF